MAEKFEKLEKIKKVEERLKKNSDEIILRKVFFQRGNYPDSYTEEITLIKNVLVGEEIKEIKINFSQFLPEGWKFDKGPKIEYDPLDQKVYYIDLTTKYSLLFLLHEIGHAIEAERLQSEGKKVSDNIFEWESEELAKHERNAWVNALKIIRDFRKKGIVLEESMKDFKELKNHIYTLLDTYQYAFPHEKGFTKDKDFEKTMIAKVIEILEKSN